ncbi:MAG: hypothetical protein ACXITV_07605 [Luteibaculaceae bacterium]
MALITTCKRYLVFPLFSLTLLGCTAQKEKQEAPLSRQQFIEAVVTFSLIEGSYNVAFVSKPDGLQTLGSTYAYALDSLQVSTSDFEETFNFYLQDPKEMSAIFEEAISIITARKALHDAENPNEAVGEE